MKKILLAVSGLSPQILTESLYALAVATPTPFVPDEIHLITTSEGAERARLLLLSQDPGWYFRLCREYDLPAIAFRHDRVHVITDASGAPMADIRTPQDNSAAADFITAMVRQLTDDGDTALHASIAGGRKSMGFYLGYALSLFGRSQDALSHVLVNAPYESLPDFFFPTRDKTIIYTREGKPLDSSQGSIWLATIPFVRMRQGIPLALQQGNATFSAVVAAATQAFIAPALEICARRRNLIMPIGEVDLPPADLAFYIWLARLRLRGEGGVRCPTDGVADCVAGSAVLDIYRQLNNFGVRGHDRTEEALGRGMRKSYFEQRKSRTNKAIRLGLGVNGSPYEIVRTGIPGHYRFGLLQLEADQIVIGKPDAA
ncbi:MAG: CRISPR-associated ring nuclease Csm6 [Mariprofundales bacterium]|nr:CRISPR-associated ring nuclease Csm6 [Mariprofundales bacterium]